MIRINLLPFRAARTIEFVRMQISIYVLSVILLFVVMGYFHVTLGRDIKELRAEEAQLQKEYDSYAEMTKRMNKLKKNIEDLRVKLDVIRKLEAKKAGPVQLLDEVAMAVPKGKLFLQSLSDSQGTLRMQGTAKDNDTVALFMTNLENIEKIKSVALGSAQRRTAGEGKKVSGFGLVCELHTE